MNKYFFVLNEKIKKIILIIFVLLILGFYSIAFPLILIFSFYLLLFRKINIVIKDIRLAESNILLSPISGTFLRSITKDSETLLVFKMNFYNNYGIYLPLNAEITDFSEGVIHFHNKLNQNYSISTRGYFFMNKAKVLVSAGDKGVVGGLLGHFPFGGKVYLEIPSHCDVIMKPGERVYSSQTILAKLKD